MWYEVLPAVLIIGSSVMIPQFAALGLNYLFLGKPTRRNVRTHFEETMVLRDARITNSEFWKTKGLESIPDI